MIVHPLRSEPGGGALVRRFLGGLASKRLSRAFAATLAGMAPPQNREAFTIEDFTPGIRQVRSPNHKPGTATDTNTFGCFAGHDGVLRALPGVSRTIDSEDIVRPSAGTLDTSQYRIAGTFANNPVFSTDVANPTTPGLDQCNTELWIGVEYWDSDVNEYHQFVARYSRHTDTPAWEIVSTNDAAGTYDSTSRPRRCTFGQTRSNSADSDVPGPIVIAWVFAGWARFSPDDTTPTTTSSAALPTNALLPPDDLVCHQNRAVIFPLVSLGANDDTVHPDNEAFYWTAPNNLTILDALLGGSYSNTVAYVEASHGYEVMVSNTADQLLLIKRSGGGLFLRGDLNAFIARSLPQIVSAGLSLNHGAPSTLGFMYPVDNDGVWVWTGGDTSVTVTPDMEDNFWRPEPQNPAFGTPAVNEWGTDYTSSARWRNFNMFPGQWLFDTQVQAWWRLDDPAQDNLIFDNHQAIVDWTGRWLWLSPSGYDELQDTPIFIEYDAQVPRSDYTWTSHPFAFSLDQSVLVDEVVFTIEGFNSTSTCAVTLTSENSSTTQTFDVPNGLRIVRMPTNFGIRGTSVYMTIAVDSNDTDEAPRIHKVEMQWNPELPAARAVAS